MSFENPAQEDQEGKVEVNKNFEEMSFFDFEGLPNTHPYFSIFQNQMLKYLKTEDTDYFEQNYSGEVDSEGYLFRKDGSNSNSLPSQNTSSKLAMEQVVKMTQDEIRETSSSPVESDPQLILDKENKRTLKSLFGEDTYDPMEMDDYLSYVSPEDMQSEVEGLKERLDKGRQSKEQIIEEFKKYISYKYAAN